VLEDDDGGGAVTWCAVAVAREMDDDGAEDGTDAADVDEDVDDSVG